MRFTVYQHFCQTIKQQIFHEKIEDFLSVGFVD